MKDECFVCHMSCGFLQVGLFAGDICPCCRKLAGKLYPSMWMRTDEGRIITTYTGEAEWQT